LPTARKDRPCRDRLAERYEVFQKVGWYFETENIDTEKYSLVPSKNIEFVNRYENINFDEKMNKLRDEFTQLLQEKEQSKQDLPKVFNELGYEINL
jgi:type I restriction enzyme M protein